MYFIISGSWAICFYSGQDKSEIQINPDIDHSNKNFDSSDSDGEEKIPLDVSDNRIVKAKLFKRPNYIGDYYCINAKKARYYYMAWN